MTNPLTVVLLVMAAASAPDAAELTRLLNEFLAGAGKPGAAVHERFWADDLIYTGSSGRRVGKTDILRDVRSATDPGPGDPEVTYSAEDIRIQQYGNAALVAFRLVANTVTGGRREVAHYFNTGMFLERNGTWQAVGWQATKVPPSDVEAQRGAASAAIDFHRAILVADTTTLVALAGEGFVWVREGSEPITRRRLLNELDALTFRDSLPGTDSVTVSIHGETAIVRGLCRHPPLLNFRGVNPERMTFRGWSTLTLVREGGGWKAVAMHTTP